jgi:flagellar M-ring protein FliF
LVRSTIGFDAKRGDQVEVANLRLAETPATPIGEQPTGIWALLQFTKDDIMRGVELAVMALLSLVVLLMVVRPLVRRIIGPQALRAQPNAPEGGPAFTVEASPPIPIPSNKTANMIDIAQVRGQVQAQSVEKVGVLADKNPEETISIIRGWLHEEAAA